MFEEGQLYAPVTEADDGSVHVHLADDGPGAHDPAYRARRDQPEDFPEQLADLRAPRSPATQV